ncbi:MAG: hypothetical protein LBP80_02665, partial [Treponema sp.]|nr:hypothetical protein [Treponema sp.]
MSLDSKITQSSAGTETGEAAVCPSCGAGHSREEIDGALKTCPSCGYHYRMEPAERLRFLA